MAGAQWQVGKSVVECNEYILQNQVECDVQFGLITNDGSQRTIGAHRIILLSRSPVLEAMVSERWNDGNTRNIKIEDVEYGVFWEFLRFVYYEKCDITPANVLPLSYTAKKYMIRQLEDKCTEYLANSLNVENVCELLEQSLMYGADDSASKCVSLICNNAPTVLPSQQFLLLSQKSVEKIIENDTLAWDEENIFNACIKWAHSAITRKEKVISEEEVRCTLGPILHSIRFPLFSNDEFSKNQWCSSSDLLTTEEKLDIYQHLCSNGTNRSKLFNCNRRTQRHITCNMQPGSRRARRMGNTWRCQNCNMTQRLGQARTAWGFNIFNIVCQNCGMESSAPM